MARADYNSPGLARTQREVSKMMDTSDALHRGVIMTACSEAANSEANGEVDQLAATGPANKTRSLRLLTGLFTTR